MSINRIFKNDIPAHLKPPVNEGPLKYEGHKDALLIAMGLKRDCRDDARELHESRLPFFTELTEFNSQFRSDSKKISVADLLETLYIDKDDFAELFVVDPLQEKSSGNDEYKINAKSYYRKFENPFLYEAKEFFCKNFSMDANQKGYIDLDKHGLELLNLTLNTYNSKKIGSLLRVLKKRRVHLAEQKTSENFDLVGVVLNLFTNSPGYSKLSQKPMSKYAEAKRLINWFGIIIRQTQLKSELQDFYRSNIKKMIPHSDPFNSFQEYWQDLKHGLNLRQKISLVKDFAAIGMQDFTRHRFSNKDLNTEIQEFQEKTRRIFFSDAS